MALFGKKKETNLADAQSTLAPDAVKSVKILGSGCVSCHTLLVNTRQALKNLGLETEAEYVTDMEKVMAYGVMSTPALVVNEKVVAMGKVLKPQEVEKLLLKL